jgi:hypothetical protein
MIGIVGVLTGAVGVIGQIRSVAASVRSIHGGFVDAGGGIRGVARGARVAAEKLLPDAAQEARRKIDGLRGPAMGELNGIIGGLRRELADLRAGGGDTPAVEAVECRLVSAMQCRLDLQKAVMECEYAIRVCELERVALADLCDVGEPADLLPDLPVEKPVVPFLRQGIQERHPHDALRIAGCYFFALYRWAEHALGRPLGEDNVVGLFERCVDDGSVRENAFVNDPVRVLNTLCGGRKFSRVSNHSNDPDAERAGAEGAFIRRVRNGDFGTHFVLDISGYTWDSLGSNAHNYRPAGLREIV